MAIVNYKQVAQTSYKRLKDNPKISDKNKTDFRKYLNGIEVSDARLGIIYNHITKIFEVIPDVIGTMEDRDTVNKTFKRLRSTIKPGYLETVKKVGKAYVRWHNNGQTPNGWLDIKNGGKDVQKRDLSPKDMLTWDDGLALGDASRSVQIKAVLMTQLDGGFRPSEFIGLRYGDVEQKKGFIVAHVKGKTGKRDVILYKAVPYLRRWLDMHPTKVDKDPLWVSEKDKGKAVPYKYHSLLARVHDLTEKLYGEKWKPVDFYNLRHSACYLSKLDNVNPELAARKFGHSVKYYTDTYARLDVDDDIKRYEKHYGKARQQEKAENEPVRCEVCDTMNEPRAEFCEKCRNPLSMAKALEMVSENENLRKEVDVLKANQATIVRRYMPELLKQSAKDIKGAIKLRIE